MGTSEETTVKFMAAVRQEDGRIIWKLLDTEQEAIESDYRTEAIAEIAQREQEVSDLSAKLVEQQQLNAMLQKSLAETTSHVLTLCKVLQRLVP